MNVLDFGRKLRDLREKSGMSQRQLAEHIGTSKATVSLYELHQGLPPADVLANAAVLFRVSTDYLLGFDKIERADLSGLDEKDKELVYHMIAVLREKNRK